MEALQGWNSTMRAWGAAIGVVLQLSATPVQAQPWAPGQEPPPAAPVVQASEAKALETLRLESKGPEGRKRYLKAAHELLHRYWGTKAKPELLFAGDQASGCGVKTVVHPMAFYCPTSNQIAMALDLRQSVRSAKGLSEQDLLLLDFAVLAHEWGHHVNREKGRGPYGGGMGLTVKQEELAADWRTGVVLGWLLNAKALGVERFTQTANLMFEMGDYERISHQHHGYPKDRFQALTKGLSSQISPGQQLGDWHVDTTETFSRALPPEPEDSLLGTRRYEVQRFEIERGQQIATNLLGGLLGAASCIWGSQDQCLGMAMQQGKGRADGRYTQRQLTLWCSSGRFDVSADDFDPQAISRDGKGQAAVLAARDCAPKP